MSLPEQLSRRWQLVALATLVTLLVGCSNRVYYPTVDEAAKSEGVMTTALAQVDDNHLIGARSVEGAMGVELLAFQLDAQGWRLAQVERRDLAGDPYAVQVAVTPAAGGWTGTYLFGIAGPAADMFTLDRSDERGGRIVDGAWAIVIDAADVDAHALGWRFLAADGAPLLIGTGPLPAS